jgi:hypothetical protein
LHAESSRQVASRHDCPQRSCLRRDEEGGPGALDEGDERDVPERDLIEQDRRGQARERDSAHAVGQDHDPLAVPAIGGDAGE